MKKLALFLAVVLLLAAALPVTALAVPEVVGSGKVGRLKWTLDEEGTLTIRGKGAMPDFGENKKGDWVTPPWTDCGQELREVVVEKGVTSIGAFAFAEWSSLTSVTLPAGLKSIGGMAFVWCDGLESVEIPDSVTNIGTGAFSECGLVCVTIPEKVKTIGGWAFSDCVSLTDVYFAGSEKKWKAIRIGEDAFPEGVTIHYKDK